MSKQIVDFGVHTRGLSYTIEQYVAEYCRTHYTTLRKKSTRFGTAEILELARDTVDSKKTSAAIPKVLAKLKAAGMLHLKRNKKGASNTPACYWLSRKGAKYLDLLPATSDDSYAQDDAGPDFTQEDVDPDLVTTTEEEVSGEELDPIEPRTTRPAIDAVASLSAEASMYRTYLLRRRKVLRAELEELDRLLGE